MSVFSNVFSVIALEFLVPFVLFIVIARRRVKRQRALRAAADYIDPPFASEPPRGSRWLDRALQRLCPQLTPIQRGHLTERVRHTRPYFLAGIYMTTAFLTVGLLPAMVNRYGIMQPFALRVWYSFLNVWCNVCYLPMDLLAMLAGIISAYYFTQGAAATLYRTRPLSLPFLYWSRIAPAALTFIGMLAVSMALSFALLLVSYGPVWRHLDDEAGLAGRSMEQVGALPQHSSKPLRTVNLGTPSPGAAEEDRDNVAAPASAMASTLALHRQEMRLYLVTLSTSAPRLALSLLTTMLLIFSLILALNTLPFQFLRGKNNRPGLIVFGGTVAAAEIAQLNRHLLFPRFDKILFLYFHLGPPPPLRYAAVPLTLAILSLWAASRFIRRIEL